MEMPSASTTEKAAADFTVAFVVDQTAKQAFDAINNVRGWWSEGVDGVTDEAGADWVFEVPGVHYSKQKVIELVPDQRVVWQVLESRLTFIEDEEEWTGTTIVFEIERSGDKTEVRFTHRGLAPDVECFDACSDAWSGYIEGSLRSLIATGTGRPIRKG